MMKTSHTCRTESRNVADRGSLESSVGVSFFTRARLIMRNALAVAAVIGAFTLGAKTVEAQTLTPTDNVLYVSATAQGTGDGSSWANAAAGTRLQEALNVAGADTICVSAGTYVSNTGTNAFSMSAGKILVGGYSTTGTYDPAANVTTLKRESGSGRIVLMNPGTVAAPTTLRGVTVTGGTGVNGAGIHGGVSSGNLSGCVLVDQCVVTGNAAAGNGGGMYACGAVVVNTVFSNNRSTGHGGGVGCGATGAANASTFTGCDFVSNTSNNQGGGLHASYTTVNRCRFYGNGAGEGGPFYATNSTRIYNSLITGNTCTGYGSGGTFMGGTPRAYHCSFVNTGVSGKEYFSGTGGGTLYNCIVWEATLNVDQNNNTTLHNCAVTIPRVGGGANNITLSQTNTADNGPKFINPSTTAGADADWQTRDWRFLNTSICVGKGQVLPGSTGADATLIATDYAGVERNSTTGFDVGMYQKRAPVLMTSASFSPAETAGAEPINLVLTFAEPSVTSQITLAYSGTASRQYQNLPTTITVPEGVLTYSVPFTIAGVASGEGGTLIATMSSDGNVIPPADPTATLTINAGANVPARDEDGYILITNNAQLSWFARQVNAGAPTLKGKIAADFNVTSATDLPIPDFAGELIGATRPDGGRYTVGIAATGYKRLVEKLLAGGVLGGFNVIINNTPTIESKGFVTGHVTGGTIRDMLVTVNVEIPVPGGASVSVFGRSNGIGSYLENVTVHVAQNAVISATAGWGCGAFFSDMDAEFSTTYEKCTVILDGLLKCQGTGESLGGFVGAAGATHTAAFNNCAIIIGATGGFDGGAAGGYNGILVGNARTAAITCSNTWIVYDKANTSVPVAMLMDGGTAYPDPAGTFRVERSPEHIVLPQSEFSIFRRNATTSGLVLKASDETNFADAANGYIKLTTRTQGQSYPVTFTIVPTAALNDSVSLVFTTTVKSSDILETTGDNIVEIKTNAQMAEYARLADEEIHTMRGVTTVLAGDVELTGNYVPMGTRYDPYYGTLTGSVNESGEPLHTITFGVTATAWHAGLIGYGNCTLENIGLSVPAAARITGTDGAGALAGQLGAGATVRNCHAAIEGRISVEGAKGIDVSQRSAGGLIGRFTQSSTVTEVRIEKCKVTLGATASINGAAGSARNVGGFIGSTSNGQIASSVVLIGQNVGLTASTTDATSRVGLFAGSLEESASVVNAYAVAHELGSYFTRGLIGASSTTGDVLLSKITNGAISLRAGDYLELGAPSLEGIFTGQVTSSEPNLRITDEYQLISDAVGLYPASILTFTGTDLPSFEAVMDVNIYLEQPEGIMVSLNGGTAMTNGNSWTTAFSMAQMNYVVAEAIRTGRSIWMQAGTYPQYTFPAGAYTVYGGFQGSDTETVATRARSDLNGDGVISPWEFTHPTIFEQANAQPVMTVNANVTVDGVTVQGGSHGVFLQGSNAVLCNAIVQNNVGPAVYSRGVGVTVGGRDNGTNGAKLLNSLVCNNFQTGSSGSYVSESSAGVLSADRAMNSIISGCMIIGNHVDAALGAANGGVGGFYGGQAGSSITYNTVIANNTGWRAGGLDGTPYGSGAVHFLYNMTVVNNKALGTATGGIHRCLGLFNSIISGNINTDGESDLPAAGVDKPATATASAYRGSTYMDLDLYPSPFVDSTTFVGAGTTDEERAAIRSANWRLMPNGFAINRGHMDHVQMVDYALVDPDGHGRIYNRFTGGMPDIGAYEFQGPGYVEVTLDSLILPYSGERQVPTYKATAPVPMGMPEITMQVTGEPVDPGTYPIVAVFADPDNWVSSLDTTFAIIPYPVREEQVIVGDGSGKLLYDGTLKTLDVHFVEVGPTISPADYDVTYSGERRNVTAEGFTVTITMKNNFSGTIHRNIKITPIPVHFAMTNPTVAPGVVWPNMVTSPAIDPDSYNIILRYADDFHQGDNIPAATYDVVITMLDPNYGVGDNAASTMTIQSFYVTDDVLNGDIQITNTEKIYNGSQQRVTVILSGGAVGGDTSVTYGYTASTTPPTNAGKYYVMATVHIGADYNRTSAVMTIEPYAITSDMITFGTTQFLYNGTEQAPTFAGVAEIPAFTTADYDIHYVDLATGGTLLTKPTGPGTYRMDILFKRNFAGSVSTSYDIYESRIRHVAPVLAGDGSGRDWANAATVSSLQDFIDLAGSELVKEIRLAGGNYTASTLLSLGANVNLPIRGGYNAVTGEHNPAENLTALQPASGARLFATAAGAQLTVEDITIGDFSTALQGAVSQISNGTQTYNNCIFANIASTNAGIFDLQGTAVVTLNFNSCVFRGCSFTWGILHGANPTTNQRINIDRTIFVHNILSTTGQGSAGLFHTRCPVVVTNSVFAGNGGMDAAGVLLAPVAQTIALSNCTVAKNSGTLGEMDRRIGNSTNLSFRNSFIWTSNLGTATVDASSCIVGGADFDPMFAEEIDYTNVDSMVNATWTPGAGSPLVNGASSLYITSDFDYLGNPRVHGGDAGIPDIGATESTEKGEVIFEFSSLKLVYNSTPLNPVVSIGPAPAAALPFVLSYEPTGHTDVGTYIVTATVTENEFWQGSDTAILTIAKYPSPTDSIRITVPSGVMADGQPHGVEKVEYFNPFSLQWLEVAPAQYSVTYNGSAEVPVKAGEYTARVLLELPNFTGGADANYTIQSGFNDVNVVFPTGLTYSNIDYADQVTVTGIIGGQEVPLVAGVDYTINFVNTRIGATQPTIPNEAGTYNVRIVVPSFSDSTYTNAFTIAPRPVVAGDILFSNDIQPSTGDELSLTLAHAEGYPVVPADYTVAYTLGGSAALPILPGTYTATYNFQGNYSSASPLTATLVITDPTKRYVSQVGAGLKTGFTPAHAAPFVELHALLNIASVTDVYLAGSDTYYGIWEAISDGVDNGFKHRITVPAGKGIHGGYNPVTWVKDVENCPSVLTIHVADHPDSWGVVGLFAGARIDGFTITGGRHAYGGGLRARGNTSIKNCRFYDNHAVADENGGNGGAIVVNGQNARIEGCYFNNNTTPMTTNNANNGGAIYINGSSGGAYIYDCFFENCKARYGAAVRFEANANNCHIDSCIIFNNTARDMAAVSIASNNNKVTRCYFANNQMDKTGAHGAALRITGSSISGNFVENCIFTNNYASSVGALMNQSSGTIVRNCTFANNGGPYGAVANWSGSVALQNCIFWNNNGNAAYQNGGTVTISDCAFDGAYGGTATNVTVISTNNNDATGPRFVAPYPNRGVQTTDEEIAKVFAADWHLQSASMLLAIGNTSYFSDDAVDMEGNPRVVNGRVDLGPYQKDVILRPTVLFSNLVQREGNVTAVDVTVLPADIEYNVTYDGSPELPTTAGTYEVAVTTVAGPGYVSVTERATMVVHNGTLYVTPTGAGSRSGLSWANAGGGTDSLYAFAAASGLDELYVAGGTYAIERTLELPAGLKIYGSYSEVDGTRPMKASPMGAWDFISPTIITGTITSAGTTATNDDGRRLVRAQANCVIDGLTVSDGIYGGVQINGSNTTMRNCIVRDNTRPVGGNLGCGVTIMINLDSIAFYDCWIHNNRFTSETTSDYFNHSGAAIGCGQDGGSNFSVYNSLVSNNFGFGVAGFWTRRGNITVVNTVFANNEVQNHSNVNRPAKAVAIEIQGESTHSLKIHNCTFVNNTSTVMQGGSANLVKIVNVNGATLQSHNSVYWGNTVVTRTFSAAQGAGTNAIARAEHEGTSSADILLSATNNAVDGPNFIGPTTVVGPDDSAVGANWRLSAQSIMINRGANQNIGYNIDIDGAPRIYVPAGSPDGVVDIGAYESQHRGWATVTASDKVDSYNHAPKTVNYEVIPAGVEVTTPAYSDVGVYPNLPVTVDNLLWRSSAGATANLTIDQAAVTNVTYSCDSGATFAAGSGLNKVNVVTYSVTPAHTANFKTVFTPVDGGAAADVFPTEPGSYWVDAAIADTPANYRLIDLPRIVITVVRADGRGTLLASVPSTVAEGDSATVMFSLSPSLPVDVEIELGHNSADWNIPASITFPANNDTCEVILYTKVRGLTRTSTLTLASVTPADSVIIPNSTFEVKITHDPSQNYRFATAAGAGDRTGYSWEHAYGAAELNAAFQTDSIKTFYLAEGEYINPTPQTYAMYTLTGDKALIGGYDPEDMFNWKPERAGTVFTSTGGGRRNFNTNGSTTKPLQFNGIRINAGNRDGGSAINGSPAKNFVNCRFTNMTPLYNGGALIGDLTSGSSMYNCIVEGVPVTTASAYVFNVSGNVTIDSCRITGCKVGTSVCYIGSANTTLNISNSEISNNTGGVGTGVQVNANALAVVKNTIFRGNTTTGNAGGISLRADNSKVECYDCQFIENSGNYGGIYEVDKATGTSGLFDRCVFVGNTSIKNDALAGQFHVRGALKIYNSLILNNKGAANDRVFGIVVAATNTVEVVNCTIAGNNASALANNNTATFKNSIIYGNSFTGVGSGVASDCWMTDDPDFLDPVSFIGFDNTDSVNQVLAADYSLASTSMAINRAKNTHVATLDSDILGNARIYIYPDSDIGIVDYGAYEFQGRGNVTSVTANNVFAVYDGTPQTITYEVTPNDVEPNLLPKSYTDAGTYSITVGLLDHPLWNDKTATATLVIAPATVNLSAPDVDTYYSGLPVHMVPVTEPAGVPTTVVYSQGGTPLMGAPVEVGTYNALVSVTDTNYESATATGTITIRGIVPTIVEVPSATSIYSDEPLSSSTLSGGLVRGAQGETLAGLWAWVDSTIVPGEDSVQVVRFTPVNVNYGTADTNIIVPLIRIGNTRFVRVGGAGQKSGRTWENAMSSVQDAINDLSSVGEDDGMVYVDKGTYTGSIVVADKISIVGGFDYDNGQTDPLLVNPALTIFTADGLGTTLRQSADAVAAAEFRGFTVTGGYATADDATAGIYLNANATITNCIVTGNISLAGIGGLSISGGTVDSVLVIGNSGFTVGGIYADDATVRAVTVVQNQSANDFEARAGGIYAQYSTVTDLVAKENIGRGYGAGGAEFYVCTVSGSTFENNTSQYWAAGAYASGTLVETSRFAGNTIDGSEFTLYENNTPAGAGVYLYDATLDSAIVENNVVDGFEAAGGGVYLDNATVSNSIIKGNKALSSAYNSFGGGIYTSVGVSGAQNIVTNSLIVENYSDGYGAAVSGTDAELVNVTVMGNTAGLQLPSVYLLDGTANRIVNSILWDIGADSAIAHEATASVDVSYSVVRGGWPMGAWITDAAPLLDADYKPLTGSPSINIGNNTFATAATDLAGNARIYNAPTGIVDAGAYEFEGKGTLVLGYLLPEYADYQVVYTGVAVEYPNAFITVTPSVAVTLDKTYSGGTAPVDAGNYTATIEVDDDNWIANTLTPSIEIIPMDITTYITITTTDFNYDGTAKRPVFSASPSTAGVAAFFTGETDSSVAPMNAGSYPFVLLPTNANYTATIGGTMTISPVAATIVIVKAEGISGTPTPANVTVKGVGGAVLTAGTDYIVEYAQGAGAYITTVPSAVGTYKVRVTCQGNYTGTQENIQGVVIRPSITAGFTKVLREFEEPTAGNTGSAAFEVRLSAPATEAVDVSYTYSITGGSEGISVAPADKLTFSVGQQTQSLNVTFLHSASMADRYVQITLVASSSVGVDTATAQLIIRNIDSFDNPVARFTATDTQLGINGSAKVSLVIDSAPSPMPAGAKVWFTVSSSGAPATAGVDYTLTAPGFTKLSGSLYEAALTSSTLELTLTALSNNLPDRDKIITVTIFRIFDVPNCAILTPNKMVFTIHELDPFSLHSLAAVPFMARMPVTLPLLAKTYETEADDASKVLTEPVSTYGAALTVEGQKVVYDLANSPLSDSALEAGVADSFLIYTTAEARETATPIISRVYVGGVYSKGDVVKLPFEVLRERAGLDFSGDRFTRTPFLYATYFKPFGTVAEGELATPTKVMLKTETVPAEGIESIYYALNLTVKLFNTQAMQAARSAGFYTADVMGDSRYQLPECGLEIFCTSQESVIGEATPVPFETSVAAMIVKPPRITGVAEYVTMTGETYLRIEGEHFGAAPSVAVEYKANGAVKSLSLSRAATDIELFDRDIKAEEMRADGAVWVRLPSNVPASERLDITVNSGCGITGTTLK